VAGAVVVVVELEVVELTSGVAGVTLGAGWTGAG
jgi:hypothetical protein